MTKEIKREITDILTRISGSYSFGIVFQDWVQCLAIAISNGCEPTHSSLWKKREEQYLETINKYSKKQRMEMQRASALLTELMEMDFCDALGEIYMMADQGNQRTGQFFTPYHLSKLIAEIRFQDEIEEKVIMNEPSCGGGGMIIATADVMHSRGYNYQRILEVIAQDIDWRSVYMTYIQLSLYGIRATVIQGDTLLQKTPDPEQVFITPMKRGVLL